MIPLAIALAALTTLAFCAWLAYCDTAEPARRPLRRLRRSCVALSGAEQRPLLPAGGRLMTDFRIIYPAWMADGLCGQIGGDAFFPEKGGKSGLKFARKLCSECPVQAECLEWAMEHENTYDAAYGIWGGKTARERLNMRRERGAS